MGRDTLTGGDGYDDFYFGVSLMDNSVDVITDYNKRYDSIVLDKLFFKGIGRADGWMKPSAFWQGTKAHDSDDRIIYNPKNGIIYYDWMGQDQRRLLLSPRLDPVGRCLREIFGSTANDPTDPRRRSKASAFLGGHRVP